MKILLAFVLVTGLVHANNVTCLQTTGLTTCSNGVTAYDFGNMQQYTAPNGDSVTVWNNNINRYQEVPVSPYGIAPIQPIEPIPSLRVLEPFK